MAGDAKDDPPPLIGAGLAFDRSTEDLSVGLSAPAGTDTAATVRTVSRATPRAPRQNLEAPVRRAARASRWKVRILRDSLVSLVLVVSYDGVDVVFCVRSLMSGLPLPRETAGCARGP